MRYSRNIFENENFRGAGVRSVSAEKVTASMLTMLSGLAVLFIIANFEEITVAIAVWMAGLLTSVFPIFAVVIISIIVIVKLRARRRFWRW